MKKRKPLLLSGLTAAALISVAMTLLAGNNPAGTKATSNTKLLLQDSFNDVSGAIDETKWDASATGGNVSLSAGSNAYYDCASGSSGCEHIFFGTKERIQGLTSFSCDFRLPSDSSRWLGVNFVTSDLDSSNVDSYAYQSLFLLSNTGVAKLGSSFTFNGSSVSSVSWSDLIGQSSLDYGWVSFKIEPTSATEATVSFALQGGEYGSAITLTPSGSTSFLDAYIGFSAEEGHVGYSLDNFSIASSTVTFTEDFSNPVLNSNLAVIMKSNSTNGYSRMDSSTLDFVSAQEGNRLISKDAAVDDDSIAESVTTLEASFSLTLLSGGSEAFVFGVADAADPLNACYAIAFDNTSLSISSYSEGTATALATVDMGAAPAGETYSLSVTKTGSATLLKDGEALLEASSGVLSVAGNVGFISLANNTGTDSFDDIIVYNTTYYVPVTKSVTHNFSNDFFGNSPHEDFFLANGDGTIAVDSGKLRWSGCADNSFFGSAHQYDCFILDYKLSSIYVGTSSMDVKQRTAPTKWIGLDLARRSKGLSTYGHYAMMYFEITPEDPTGEESCHLLIEGDSSLDSESVVTKEYKKIPCSLFTPIQYDGTTKQESAIKEGDQVCIRYVSDGDSVSLYLKKASEAEFTLYCTYSNLQLNGYFAICCTGYTYITMDDFSMANTSSIYVCADNEEPETIVESETITIYDPGNVDVNLDDEISLNASDGSGWMIAAIVTWGVVALGGVSYLIYRLVRRKGHAKKQ
jgi:hypothetical protein